MSTPIIPPPRPPLRVLLFTFGGCAVAVGLLATLSGSLATALLAGSFGATCALVFGYPDVPFSQPRHVVLGHLFCVLVGLAAFHFLGSAPWVLALAVGTAAAGMMALRIMHPPATSNPIIVFLGKAAWGFALFPTLALSVSQKFLKRGLLTRMVTCGYELLACSHKVCSMINLLN